MSPEARIVVVEDQRDLAELYAGWLSERYDVTEAHTAGEALERIDARTDVVLLDRRLPDQPGREVLREIRDRGNEARVAMVTAVDIDFDIVELGFDDYITKPVSKPTLEAVVETLLTRRQYDERLAGYAQLLTKQAVLESQKSTEELERSEEYRSLLNDVERYREDLEDLTDEFDTTDFRAAFLTLNARSIPETAYPESWDDEE
jgi:DNA-binding response OmpR family regulator